MLGQRRIVLVLVFGLACYTAISLVIWTRAWNWPSPSVESVALKHNFAPTLNPSVHSYAISERHVKETHTSKKTSETVVNEPVIITKDIVATKTSQQAEQTIQLPKNETIAKEVYHGLCELPSPTEQHLMLIKKPTKGRQVPRRGQEKAFSTLKNGILTLNCTSNGGKGKYRKGGMHNMYVDYKDPVKIDTEWMWASCGTQLNSHVQHIANETLLKKAKDRLEEDKLAGKPAKPNVLLIFQDSVGREHFHRWYTETKKMFENMKKDDTHPATWFDFNMFHALGSNSLPNKCALFGGFCWEKSCTHHWKPGEEGIRRMFDKSGGIWDNQEPNVQLALEQDWLWRHFKDLGYVTMYGEEESGMGRDGRTYGGHSILHMFKQVPEDLIDHLFPSNVFKEGSSVDATRLSNCGKHSCPPKISAATTTKLCLGNKITFNLAFEYLIDFWQHYSEVPKFAGFTLNMAHDGKPDSASCLDSGIAALLEDMQTMGALENTIVVLVADHGVKEGKYFATQSGKIENLLPHLFMSVPNSILREFPELKEALTTNQNLLSTHHDLHVTMKHLPLYPQKMPITNSYSRTILDPLPDRDCEACGIPANWCLCLHKLWLPLPDEDSHTRKTLANFVLQNLNSFIGEKGRTICKELELDKIEYVYVAKQDGVETYKISFSVKAKRDMRFHAFATKIEGRFWMDQWDVEQETKWGPHVPCKKELVNLRPPVEPQFCICINDPKNV